MATSSSTTTMKRGFNVPEGTSIACAGIGWSSGASATDNLKTEPLPGCDRSVSGISSMTANSLQKRLDGKCAKVALNDAGIKPRDVQKRGEEAVERRDGAIDLADESTALIVHIPRIWRARKHGPGCCGNRTVCSAAGGRARRSRTCRRGRCLRERRAWETVAGIAPLLRSWLRREDCIAAVADGRQQLEPRVPAQHRLDG